jgi:myosin heavy subunit
MYSGMLETITIRKAGYPIRYDFDYFTGRYDVCCGNLRHNPNYSPRDKCKAILTKVLPKQDWKVGHTKVFMKGPCYHNNTPKCTSMVFVDDF